MQNLKEIILQASNDEGFPVVDIIRSKIFEPQYANLNFVDLITNESTDLPPYWQLPVSDEMKRNAGLTFAAAVLSLIMSFLIVGLYLRALMIPDRRKYRLARMANPHNHFLFFIQISAIFSSLMFIVTSSLRLWGSPRHAFLWCDTSFMIVQIFGEPQCFLEIFFLVSILVSIYKPNWLPREGDSSDVPPFVFYGSCCAYLISLVACFFCSWLLPINPEWGSRGDPTLAVWCWIPANYPNETENAPALVSAQFLTYNIWVILCPIVGIITVFKGVRAMDQPTEAVKSFFLYRLIYSLAFGIVWLPSLSSRMTHQPGAAVHSFLSFCEPLMPFVNGVIFLIAEVLPRMNKHKVFNGVNLGILQLTSRRNFIDPTLDEAEEQEEQPNDYGSVSDSAPALLASSKPSKGILVKHKNSLPNYYSNASSSSSNILSRNGNSASAIRMYRSQAHLRRDLNVSSSDDDYDSVPQSAMPLNNNNSNNNSHSSKNNNNNISAHRVTFAKGPPASASAGSFKRHASNPNSRSALANNNGMDDENKPKSNNNSSNNINNCIEAEDDEESEMNGEASDGCGVDAVMSSLTLQDRVQHRDEAQAEHIKVVFDEMTQSWSIEIDPNAEVSAESVLAKLQAVKFLQVDSYIHGAILSFLCGFGDLTGGALLKFYTAHVTGNIASWGLYVGGFETEVGLLRHGWGYLVYMIGAGSAAELFRRFKKKDNGARFLLFWLWFFLLAAFISSRTHEKIGTAEWDDSSASWLSSFCMVFAYSAVNVYQRVANAGPIFSLQTGNTTAICGDIMLFIFDCPKEWEAKKVILKRIRGNFLNIGFFTLGGIASSVCAAHRAELCFSVPALLSTIVLWIGWGVHSSSSSEGK